MLSVIPMAQIKKYNVKKHLKICGVEKVKKVPKIITCDHCEIYETTIMSNMKRHKSGCLDDNRESAIGSKM